MTKVTSLLTRFRTRAGLNKSEVAAKLPGASPGTTVTWATVDQWEKGHRVPTFERVDQLATVFKLSPNEHGELRVAVARARSKGNEAPIEEMLRAAVSRANHDAPQPERRGFLPLLGAIPAGPPIAVAQAEETFPVLEHLAKSDRYVLRVIGDSMSPDIRDGDLVLIQYADSEDPRTYNGMACVVLLDGESTLKFVEVSDAGSGVTVVILKGGRPDYPTTTFVLGTRRFRIQGVLLEIVSRRLRA